jgi:hypothetical protein
MIIPIKENQGWLTALDIEQRMPILHLVLSDDTNCLKDGLVLGDTVAKPCIQDIEPLDAPVEALVASSSPSLERFDLGGIARVSDTANWLSSIPAVRNHLLAGGDFAQKAVLLVHNRKIVLRCLKRTIDPDKSIVIDRNTKLIGKARLMELVRAPSRTRLHPLLVNATVNSVDWNDEDLFLTKLFLTKGSSPAPNNLVVK